MKYNLLRIYSVVWFRCNLIHLELELRDYKYIYLVYKGFFENQLRCERRSYLSHAAIDDV